MVLCICYGWITRHLFVFLWVKCFITVLQNFINIQQLMYAEREANIIKEKTKYLYLLSKLTQFPSLTNLVSQIKDKRVEFNVNFWDHIMIRFIKYWNMDLILLPLISCSWAMKSRNVGSDNWWPYWVSVWPRKCNFREENEKLFCVLFPPKDFVKSLLRSWQELGCNINLFKVIQFQFVYNSGF